MIVITPLIPVIPSQFAVPLSFFGLSPHPFLDTQEPTHGRGMEGMWPAVKSARARPTSECLLLT